MTTLPAALQPDCAACLGLCCVAPAFDAQQGFGYDKPAHTPCRNLDSDCRCAIHDHLSRSGFPGCLRYDCYGAGQRAVREFGDGRHWRDGPHAPALFATFQRLKALHELKALVHYTLQQIEDEGERDPLRSRLNEIEVLCRAAASNTMPPAAQKLRAEILGQLRQLLPRPAFPS